MQASGHAVAAELLDPLIQLPRLRRPGATGIFVVGRSGVHRASVYSISYSLGMGEDEWEMRPRQTNIRVLFVFDPWRSAILLVAGDKTGQWRKWYEWAIPQAEQLFALYQQERAKAEEEDRD